MVVPLVVAVRIVVGIAQLFRAEGGSHAVVALGVVELATATRADITSIAARPWLWIELQASTIDGAGVTLTTMAKLASQPSASVVVSEQDRLGHSIAPWGRGLLRVQLWRTWRSTGDLQACR